MDKLLALQNNPVDEMDEDDATPFDKLREECGVMAVYNHPDAARLTYWGLYCAAASRAGVCGHCFGGWHGGQ